MLGLLSHLNIASKAGTIHRYDHEILGSTLVRPLVGRASDAPADKMEAGDLETARLFGQRVAAVAAKLRG